MNTSLMLVFFHKSGTGSPDLSWNRSITILSIGYISVVML